MGGRCYFPICSHSNRENTKILIISVWLVLETSSLDHRSSIRRETFPDVLGKIRHDDVTWRHVTSFYVFLAKNCWKVLKKCWSKQKLPNMALPFTIYLIEHYISFNLRGQPHLYDKWFNFYRFWHEILNFRWFLLTSMEKCWRQQNFCWPSM